VTDTSAQSRVVQGLVAGIGFIGGGAILKAEGNVHGTATAVSIRTTGVVGVAVAQKRLLLAGLLAGVNLFSLRVLFPLKARPEERRIKRAAPAGSCRTDHRLAWSVFEPSQKRPISRNAR
jgi:uncharacterized membrane protein YhiD involved in acid resistance